MYATWLSFIINLTKKKTEEYTKGLILLVLRLPLAAAPGSRDIEFTYSSHVVSGVTESN